MMHLTPEELIDLAEGLRPSSSAAHLAECAQCRHELDELREMMTTIAVEVPEPSPLFWDHLSARVREAVAAEAVRRRGWFSIARWRWGLVAAVGAAVVAVAAAITTRTPAPAPATTVIVERPVADVGSAPVTEDASFMLLGDLAGALDWDAVAEAGITMDVGSADTAMTELTAGERTELQRLLQEAMSGAVIQS